MTDTNPAGPPLDRLADLLTRVATGTLSVEQALASWSLVSLSPASGSPSPSGASPSNTKASSERHLTLDLDRERRCGFPEVVYGEGKPAELIAEIIRRQQSARQPSLVTRVAPDAAEALLAEFPHARHNAVARTIVAGVDGSLELAELAAGLLSEPPPHVAVVSAGSTDAPVAEEARETLGWMGTPFRSFYDIGVAGPDRLLSAVPMLRQASAVIVIAGMEGALPAAVGGHLDAPVFAVPTSVGYGATLGGLAPLLGMLSSCASNVAVVNIDAGFKAAYLAGLVTSQLQRLQGG